MTDTLGDALPRELARVREVLAQYEATYLLPNGVGRGCLYMIHEIKAALARADRAMINGDVIEMMIVFQSLKDIE